MQAAGVCFQKERRTASFFYEASRGLSLEDSHNIMMAKKLIKDGVEEKAAVTPQEFPDSFSIYLSLHLTFFGSSFC